MHLLHFDLSALFSVAIYPHSCSFYHPNLHLSQEVKNYDRKKKKSHGWFTGENPSAVIGCDDAATPTSWCSYCKHNGWLNESVNTNIQCSGAI